MRVGGLRDGALPALFDYVSSCEASICDSTLVLSAMADNYALLQQ
jgi:hypothetical protein